MAEFSEIAWLNNIYKRRVSLLRVIMWCFYAFVEIGLLCLREERLHGARDKDRITGKHIWRYICPYVRGLCFDISKKLTASINDGQKINS